jgi:3-methyladenine DNA glycosylase AlkD
MGPSMQEADTVALEVEALIRERNLGKAITMLDPLAFGRTRFPILDRVGMRLGWAALDEASLFGALDQMISRRSVGYYVIVGSALARRLKSNMADCLEKTTEYVVLGDNWAKCDSIAERVWGQALVCNFPQAYKHLARMRNNDNRWVRRAVGVAVHYFAKRRHDATAELRMLLVLLAPRLGERNYDAIKGVGWGLKTIGKYQPKLLTRFLKNQMKWKHPTRLMLKKATTYLPTSVRRELEKQL